MTHNFTDLGVSLQLQETLKTLDITIPTDIQAKTIPLVLQQKEDLVAMAKTGTGKTAAFGIPLLQSVDIQQEAIQTLILAPTRELGQQIAKQFFKYTK